MNVEIFFSYDGEGEDEEDESFNSLIDGLPSCVTFIKLDFVKTGYFNLVLNFEKLCTKLHQKCPHVEVLILAYCDMSTGLPELINFCTQFFQGLKKFVLHSCPFEDYSGIAELKDNSNIEVLDLNSSDLSDCIKMQFSKLSTLKELRLAGTYVDDDWFMVDTSFLNQLHVLDLGSTNITASTFTTIQGHGQNLTELYLCDLRLRDHDLHFHNPVFPHLQTICLRGTHVTCEGLVSLVRSCPSLVSVYVDERLARSFSEHPFVVANGCKSGIVKRIDFIHDHDVDYLHN